MEVKPIKQEPDQETGPRSKDLEKLNEKKRKPRIGKILIYASIVVLFTAWGGLYGNLGQTFWVFAACLMLIGSVCLALGLRLELRNHGWLKWQYNGIACAIVVVALMLGVPIIIRNIIRSDQ